MIIDVNKRIMTVEEIRARDKWNLMVFNDLHTPERLALRERQFQEYLESRISVWNKRFTVLEHEYQLTSCVSQG